MICQDTLAEHDLSAMRALNLARLEGAAERKQKAAQDFLELGWRENHPAT